MSELAKEIERLSTAIGTTQEQLTLVYRANERPYAWRTRSKLTA